MKIYEAPNLELLYISQNDVLTLSDPTGDDLFDDIW